MTTEVRLRLTIVEDEQVTNTRSISWDFTNVTPRGEGGRKVAAAMFNSLWGWCKVFADTADGAFKGKER